MLKSITIRNLLSFGPDAGVLELRPLNILIGANGSGKSNFIEVLGLLKAATEPKGMFWPIVSTGGSKEWMRGIAEIEVEVETEVVSPYEPPFLATLIHHCSFAPWGGERILVTNESVTHKKSEIPSFKYQHDENGDVTSCMVYDDQEEARVQCPSLSLSSSAVGQRKRSFTSIDLDALESEYAQLAIYSHWTFGRKAPAREDQPIGMPSDQLNPECDNLAMVLSDLIIKPDVKDRILKALNVLMPEVIDLQVRPSGMHLQIYLREGDRMTPAARLSDGTLRFLCLLAILCNPKPPSTLCLEEPELGMHPDVIPEIATLLREASTRGQLIITTHSPMLMDCFSDTPEAIIVVEKPGTDTLMRRLSSEELAPWLKDYSLGQLWSRGDIGGNRS